MQISVRKRNTVRARTYCARALGQGEGGGGGSDLWTISHSTSQKKGVIPFHRQRTLFSPYLTRNCKNDPFIAFNLVVRT